MVDAVAPLDALMFRADSEPSTRAVMTGVLVLETCPDWLRVVDLFGIAAERVPRLRQRVLTPALPVGPAEWVDDPGFDVRDHLRRTAVSGDRDLGEVLRFAAAEATATFDRARPLWEATLVEGLADGSAVLLLRAHHALTDGIGAIQILSSLLSVAPTGSTEVITTGRPRPQPVTRAGLLIRHLTAAQSRLHVAQARLLRAALAWTTSPGDVLTGAVSLAGSMVSVVSVGGAQSSAMLRGRSRRRRYVAIEVPFEGLRAAAKRAGGTVNDAYLAAVVGGFRRYQHVLGVDVADVPMTVPVGLPRNGNSSSNRFTAIGVVGPATVADPVERIQRIGAQVQAKRAEKAVDVLDRLAHVARFVPGSLARRAVVEYGKRIDIQASNVAGSPVPTYFAGARVTRLFPFGPLPGIPVMTTLLSHDGICCIGLTVDPAAVQNVEDFAWCMVEGFDEVLDGHGRAALVAVG
jgi:WS/DGAT/MGAT family acyltransferase